MTSSLRIINSLEYVIAVEKLKQKPECLIPEPPSLAYLSHELTGKPGIGAEQSVEADSWLGLERLIPIDPPVAGEDLKAWIKGGGTPSKEPKLEPSITVLAEPATKSQPAKTKRLLLEDKPEISAAFDFYLNELWTPWAELEAIRRKSISIYNDFHAARASLGIGDGERLELVWGIGIAQWAAGSGKASAKIRYPIITQSCEIVLDPMTDMLQVRPRDVPPILEVDALSVMGAESELQQVIELWKETTSDANSAVIDPHEKSSFESILRQVVACMDSAGQFLQDAVSLPLNASTENLTVTDGWVLFVRKRQSTALIKDAEQLIEKTKNAEEGGVPNLLRRYVETAGATANSSGPRPVYRGLSTSTIASESRELFFPLPYNDEQVRIIENLEKSDGVVVQGPPGTGKSHTIANIISHYLASGKSVLVTAQSETALSVVREKLPATIRPLSVALLQGNADSKKDFEASIKEISSRVAQMDEYAMEKEATGYRHQVDRLHAEIHDIDSKVNAIGRAQTGERVEYMGQSVTWLELAQNVVGETPRFSWFTDRPESTVAHLISHDFDLSETAIATLRQARKELGEQLSLLNATAPQLAELPDTHEIERLDESLLEHAGVAKRIEAELFPIGQPGVPVTGDVHRWADQLCIFTRDTLQAYQRAGGDRRLIDKLTALGEAKLHEIRFFDYARLVEQVERRRLTFERMQIYLPDGIENDLSCFEAVERRVAGQRPFPLNPFANKAAKATFSEIRLGGEAPVDQAGWSQVLACMNLSRDANEVLAWWNQVAQLFGMEADSAVFSKSSWGRVVEDIDKVNAAREVREEYEPKLPGLAAKVFSRAVAKSLDFGDQAVCKKVLESLEASREARRLEAAVAKKESLVGLIERFDSPIVHEYQLFLAKVLGSGDQRVAEQWHKLGVKLEQFHSLGSNFDHVRTMGDRIRSAGAPEWARAIITKPHLASEIDGDPMIPGDWRKAWEWANADARLANSQPHREIRTLFVRRSSATKKLALAYEEMIACRAWLGVKRRTTPGIRQALQQYLDAIRSMPKTGKGKRAVRALRDARSAMTNASNAVPCWVLPHYSVSETLPSEFELFDLIIVDEASQSSISALLALARGKKVLVVGDPEQVSPSTIGIQEKDIVALRHRYLAELPFAAQMTQDKSLYDLTRVAFTGNDVVLREHFRCVPPIIEFSNRLCYDGKIQALRVAPAHERLDPPLVNLFVRGGRKEGYINKGEALAIVQEIEAISEDPKTANRSIGVVTLLGSEQAEYIRTLIYRDIYPLLEKHQIVVGGAATFQGRERDIVLVSTVYDENERRGLPFRPDIQQRVNVALSRARDRMYLVRSTPDEHFRSDSLSGMIQDHFVRPFKNHPDEVSNAREKCESGFEEEVFDALVSRGYRVTPQVRVGPYRIDMVVEGGGGRRLAIECDGDRWHGPEKWDEDMARQRVLERAGWTFWRSFASSFVRDREGVMNGLTDMLTEEGIEPIGGAEGAGFDEFVEHQTVDPYQLAAEDTALESNDELDEPIALALLEYEGQTDDLSDTPNIEQ